MNNMFRQTLSMIAGEMSQQILDKDWATTPLGPIEQWPAAWQQSVVYTLSNQFPALIAWGSELNILYNDAYREVLGSKADTLGQPMAAVWPEVWPIIEPSIRKALDGDPSCFNEAPFTLMRHGYPEQTWFDYCFSPLRDTDGAILGLLCTCIEQTSRRIALEHQRLDTLLSRLPAGVMVIEAPTGKIRYANDFAVQLFGEDYPREGIETYLEQWAPYHPDDRPFELDEIPAVRALNGLTTIGREMRFRRTNGLDYIDLEVNGTPIFNDEGQVVEAVVTMVDITKRIQTEVALQQSIRQLANANQELEAFSYSVSHDLRAPLRTISGFSDILREDYYEQLNEDGRELIFHIMQGAEQMNALIDDMLRLYKVTRKEIEFEMVDLSELARSIIEEFNVNEAHKDRDVLFCIQDNMLARCDYRLIRIALTNLLENAWKYTSKTLDPQIEFGCERHEGQQIFHVRDNGAGFSQELTERMFEPFQRLHTDSEFTGTGIGLPIVKRVIGRHGGKIWAEGEIGKGATFYFSLM